MQTFTFDLSFQRSMLRLMMLDGGFASKVHRWVDSGMFTSPALGWIYGVFESYWKQYDGPCSEMVLRDAARTLPDDKAYRYTSEIDLIVQIARVNESEYIAEKLADFVKQAIFARAHQDSVKPFNAGKTEEAYRVMMQAMEKIQEVDFNDVARSWLFDELLQRQQQRHRDQMDFGSRSFTTGIRGLDDLTDGGVHLGELWAVFAYAKRCKTTWLINQGFNATRVHRMPTLHLLLEGRLETATARYDACFSGELYTRVKRGDIDAKLYYSLQNEYQSLRKLLVVRRLDGWDNTIDDVRAELQYLKSTYGFVPKMLITDYADLGRKRDASKNENETGHQIGFSRDLKRLHENEEIAGWTAWQATRPSKGAHTRKHVLSSANVADAYAKVRIVSAYGSLNATDEEMEMGVMRYFHEGHRDAPVNRTWKISNDLERMRMITTAEVDEEDAA